MNRFSTKVLSLLLAFVVALLPLQSLAGDTMESHGQHAGEAGLVHIDLSQDDCDGCDPADCCGLEDCHVAPHCISLSAVIVSGALGLSESLALHQLLPSDAHAASLLITSIYRPPRA